MKIMEKIYISLCVFFCVLIVMGNLTYQKFVSINILPFHTFELSVGAILYPLTFLVTDLIAEFYGKERARFCVHFAIIINIIAATIISIMDFLPATSWSKIDDTTFHSVFGFYSIAFIGSIIACYIAQTVDVLFYLWLRKLTGGRHLWLRNNGSTLISLFIDTFIVIWFMSTFGALPKEQMWVLIFNSYSWKLFFTVCSTPLFYISVAIIKIIIKEPITSSNPIENSLKYKA